MTTYSQVIPSLILMVFSLFTYPKTVVSLLSNETDRISLLSFKNLIAEDPSESLTSWNDSKPICSWQGVTCGIRNQRVILLNLTSYGLTGPISPAIGNLSYLRYIDLPDNHFNGGIPRELGGLLRLEHLNFSGNALQGEIPENLSNCSKLRVLDLSYNNLVGKLPVSIGSLSKLTWLEVYSNNFIGRIPPSLGNLSNLHNFSLGFNQFEGTIPDSIGRLTNLRFFGVAVNNLSGVVPLPIYNFTFLKYFYISNNHLTGSLPPDMGLTLPNLQVLSIGRNRFTGKLPASLSNASELVFISAPVNSFFGPIPINLGIKMKYLQALNLGQNSFGTGKESDLRFLDSLNNCSNLELLAMNENGFGGDLLQSFTNLSTQIIRLVAGGNKFVGTIPTRISSFVNLIQLSLENNFLSGPIPSEIGKLGNLNILSLSSNELSGFLPSSLSNLSRIYRLRLNANNLSGSISSALGSFQNLETFDLSRNLFTGSIPGIIGNLLTLAFVDFGHNSFTGSLPPEIGYLKNLQVIFLHYNEFSGEIPSTIGNCLKLETLHLEGNFFQGTIPSSISSLRGIVNLDISQNNLSGKIPTGMQMLPYLQHLNLSFNHLEGEVPTQGVFLNFSAFSVVGNQELCGGIQELNLPVCLTRTFTRNRKPKLLKIVVVASSVGLFLFLVSLFGVLYWKVKQRDKTSSNLVESDKFFGVSYGELCDATERFSSANRIGAGSFSTVYKGRLYLWDKVVAVKVLNLNVLGASKSFLAECEVLRNTRHRNLLKVITSCSSVDFAGNDFKAIVSEFMPNGSLEQWLHHCNDGLSEGRSLNFLQRLNIAIDVAAALDYLHHQCQSQIVHCDVKPSNVLLDEDMTSHLGDFGLSRFLMLSSADVGHESSSVAIKGTIGYVPPEYGLGGKISQEGDVYSFGILLLEILTGKRPTDDTFVNGLNLPTFCKIASTSRVMEIVDPCLHFEEPTEDGSTKNEGGKGTTNIGEYLTSLLRIGIACSSDVPNDRMDIKDVLVELTDIREGFLGVGLRGRRGAKMEIVEGTSEVKVTKLDMKRLKA